MARTFAILGCFAILGITIGAAAFFVLNNQKPKEPVETEIVQSEPELEPESKEPEPEPESKEAETEYVYPEPQDIIIPTPIEEYEVDPSYRGPFKRSALPEDTIVMHLYEGADDTDLFPWVWNEYVGDLETVEHVRLLLYSFAKSVKPFVSSAPDYDSTTWNFNDVAVYHFIIDGEKWTMIEPEWSPEGTVYAIQD